MNIKCIFFFVFLLCSFRAIQAQEVNNVQFYQGSNNTIIVKYKITGGKFYQNYDVTLYVSNDDGKSFQGPLKSVTGDVGKNIHRGSHIITWDVFKDVASLNGDILFDIRATISEEKIIKKFFFAYTCNISVSNGAFHSPFGLQTGMLGKTGWYVSCRLNKDFLTNGSYNYIYENDAVIGFDGQGYYVFEGAEYKPRLSLTGGLIFQPARKFFLYMGAGYGSKALLWNAARLSYENDALLESFNVKLNGYSVSGIEAETGFIFKANKMLFSLGYSSLNFKYSFVNMGVGLVF